MQSYLIIPAESSVMYKVFSQRRRERRDRTGQTCFLAGEHLYDELQTTFRIFAL